MSSPAHPCNYCVSWFSCAPGLQPPPSFLGISSLVLIIWGNCFFVSSLHLIPSHSCPHHLKSLHTSLPPPRDTALPHPSKTAHHTVQLAGLRTQFIRIFPNNLPPNIIWCNYLSAPHLPYGLWGYRLSYILVLQKGRHNKYGVKRTAHHMMQFTGLSTQFIWCLPNNLPLNIIWWNYL